MDSTLSWPTLLPFLLGLASGGLLAWLWLRGRFAGLEERLRASGQELERTHSAQRESEALKLELTKLQAERQADAERLAWMRSAEEQLRATFHNLANEALQRSSQAFLDRSGERLDGLLQRHRAELKGVVQPVEKHLDSLGRQVQEIERLRKGAYEGLTKEIHLLRDAHHELSSATVTLREALRSPTVRGRWGEIQLRRVVEMAGLVKHVDFSEQATAEGLRPDMVVRLPHGGVLPVDAKSPMKAYLQAVEAPDEGARTAHLETHVKALRQRVAELGHRSYWQQFERAPDFVVMFLPNDASLGSAFERDPDLLDFAMRHRVLPATPITLLALLKAVAYGWQQQQLAENARRIADAGQKLHARVVTFVGHLQQVGKGLDSAVEAYNKAVGSLESRLLPQARRFEELGAATSEIPEPPQVERGVRQTDRGS